MPRTLLTLGLLSCLLGCNTTSLLDPTTRSAYTVYIAGPDAFLPEPVAAVEQKKSLINQLNIENNWGFELVGLYPLDNQIEDFKPDFETGLKIYTANLNLMNQADFIIANMVRFRGPGMDAGTAFEMGYMAGLGKPVFAYYDAEPFYGEPEEPGVYRTRVKTHYPVATNGVNDIHGQSIENFEMVDGLMIVGSLQSGAGEIAGSFSEAVLDVVRHIQSSLTPQCAEAPADGQVCE